MCVKPLTNDSVPTEWTPVGLSFSACDDQIHRLEVELRDFFFYFILIILHLFLVIALNSDVDQHQILYSSASFGNVLNRSQHKMSWKRSVLLYSTIGKSSRFSCDI